MPPGLSDAVNVLWLVVSALFLTYAIWWLTQSIFGLTFGGRVLVERTTGRPTGGGLVIRVLYVAFEIVGIGVFMLLTYQLATDPEPMSAFNHALFWLALVVEGVFVLVFAARVYRALRTH